MGDGLAVQPDRKIVSFGRVPFAVSAVLRLNQNGSLDTGFGSNGIAHTHFGTSYGLAGAIQSDGKILFMGYTWTGGDVVLARFHGDPASAVSGRVKTPGGSGLRNAMVTLTDATGNRRAFSTGTLGFYSFADIPNGQTVTIAVSSRRYRFEPITRTVYETLADVDIVGIE